MLNRNTKKKSLVIYILVMVLGLSLSLFVSHSITKIELSTLTLVESQMPSQQLTIEFSRLLSEKERLLYEYYATEDTALFKQYNQTNQQLMSALTLLSTFSPSANETEIIENELAQIDIISTQLIKNLDNSSTDWDLARMQLNQITQLRLKTKQRLATIKTRIRDNVLIGYQDTKSQLSHTIWIVNAFSFAIIVIALVVGRYVQAYINESAKSIRLALFPERNPNPILSLDSDENIIYANPAALCLMKNNHIAETQHLNLLPDDYHALIKKLKSTNAQTVSVEHVISTSVLLCEFHWLADVNQIDVHILDITSQKRAEQELTYKAYHYDNTDLFNHHKLNKVLSQSISNSNTKSFSLMLIKLRKYNLLVSNYGFEAVTELSLKISERLKTVINDDNRQGHIDLFQLNEATYSCVFYTERSRKALRDLYQQIESQMEQVFQSSFGSINIELDYGVVRYPDNGDSYNILLKNAHIALDKAADISHSTLVFFDQQLSDKLARQNYLIDELANAIAHNRLSLQYQPQQHLATKRINGAETLCRWQLHGEHISPEEFIGLAEQSGLIIPLGEWILATACQQAKTWQGLGVNICVAVNISPRQFIQPNFVEVVQNALVKTGLQAHLLELEITEGVLMHQEQDTITTLQQLKQLGVALSIDDFGTGYSSLSYLKQFPVDKLKIDQSFIKNLHQSQHDQAIVKTIVDLAKNLNLELIAEGVELEQHFDFLAEIDCDNLQGYLFSRPLKSEQFIEFYKESSEISQI